MDNKEIIDIILEIKFDNIKLDLLKYNDIKEFALMKINEMRYHIQSAKKLGIQDNYCINFNEEDAINDLEEYNTFIIKYNNIVIGFIQISDFPYYGKDNVGIKIDNLYIKEQYRNKGIATNIINNLKNKFDNISLEVWYEIDSLKKYESIGFREIGKIMLLD